ncbi:MAG: CapA family protein [Chloroflexi bacterium]|nr:CapA family protein [Chloroflexota bacterium]
MNTFTLRRCLIMLTSFALLGALLMGACQGREDPAHSGTLPSTAGDASLTVVPPTPFQSIDQTPTASVVNLWLSPGLPDKLRTRMVDLVGQGAGGFHLDGEESAAQVKVEPGGELRIAEWVYSLVAPFPTVEDGMSYESLRALWSGEAQEGKRIFLTEDVFEVMSAVMGIPSRSWVHITAPEDLLERAWEERPAYAIVPFEDLEPGWKVLELDGQSPIRVNFDQDAYPLIASFSISGDTEVAEQLRAMLDTPFSNYDPNKLTTLVMTGVTALTRATAWKMESHGIGYPGELIGEWLREADFAHVSNEVSFSESCPTPDPSQVSLRFCSDPAYIGLFEEIGVDLVELSGNHNLDWGEEAYLYSLDLYQQLGMSYFAGGANLDEALEPVLLEHNGNRLAFLGCNAPGPGFALAKENQPGAAPCASELIWERVGILADDGYLPIVTFQWAENVRILPAQREDFRKAIDSGAVIVSGSQAHQPMPFEFYDNGFIHYGLGNLFFDQMQELALRQEFIDRHVFYDGRHISTELLTALLENYAQPRPMSPSERSVLLERIFADSGW